MERFISSATGIAYKRIAKPILFMQAPDGVHERMLHAASLSQRFSPIRSLMRACWAYRNPAILGQTLHNITFENPVGLSAGFDKNFQLPPTIKAVGFGFMEGGSLTYRECSGNPRPWFYRLPQARSLVVNAGLANQGVSVITKRLRSYPANMFENFPLNISVAKTNSPEACNDADAVDDYVGSLKAIKKARVGAMITLNISCPNAFGGEPFTTHDRLDMLLTAVDAVKLAQPVFIKMPINLPNADFDALLSVASKHRVAGVTIGNLSKDRTGLKGELPNSVPGNLSGKPTFTLSNDLIARTYRTYGTRFTIIGVGGIFSAEDAYKKIKLGASLVELITGMIFQGPQLIGQINRGLVELLHKDGYDNVSQAIGADIRD